MARNEWFVGTPSRIGITVNAAGATQSWGGTAQTLRYFKPMSGQLGATIGRQQTHLDALSVDPLSVSTGGRSWSGSFQLPLSYAYHEGLLRLILGGADTSAGDGPYTHTLALADPILYGTLVYYYENYKGTRTALTITNAVITQVTIEQTAQNRPTISVSWVGQKGTLTTPGAAPSLVTPEFPDWDDCTLTVGGEALIGRSFSLDIATGAEEGDFGIGSADSPDVVFVGRSSARVVTLTVDAGADDVTEGWLIAGTAISTNSINWDNGATSTDNRDITITLSDLYPQPADSQKGTFGKLNHSLTFLAVGATQLAVVTTNGITASEPPAP